MRLPYYRTSTGEGKWSRGFWKALKEVEPELNHRRKETKLCGVRHEGRAAPVKREENFGQCVCVGGSSPGCRKVGEEAKANSSLKRRSA